LLVREFRRRGLARLHAHEPAALHIAAAAKLSTKGLGAEKPCLRLKPDVVASDNYTPKNKAA
jgi:hypothetical protein